MRDTPVSQPECVTTLQDTPNVANTTVENINISKIDAVTNNHILHDPSLGPPNLVEVTFEDPNLSPATPPVYAPVLCAQPATSSPSLHNTTDQNDSVIAPLLLGNYGNVFLKKWPEFPPAHNYTCNQVTFVEFRTVKCIKVLSPEFQVTNYCSKDWSTQKFHASCTFKIEVDSNFVPVYELHKDSQIYSTVLVIVKSHVLAPPAFPFDFKVGVKTSDIKCSFTFLVGLVHMKVFVISIETDIVDRLLSCGCMIVDCGLKGFGLCLSSMNIDRLNNIVKQ